MNLRKANQAITLTIFSLILATVIRFTTQSILTLFVLAIIASCAVQRTATTAPETQTVIAAKSPTETLLDKARLAFERNHLKTPESTSAFRFYKEVLSIDPQNEEARSGIADIAERYLTWALDNANANNHERARRYIDLAYSVDHSHPNIEPILQRIKEREQAVVTAFELDSRSVKQRRTSKMLFRQIAKQIKPNETFVTISAPDDASGRWLYQELNKRVDFRVPAEFKIGEHCTISLTK